MIKQYVYLIYDRFAKLPVGTIVTNTEPDQFVELQNRQNLRQPIQDADSLDIYCVSVFNCDIDSDPPFPLVGDFHVSCDKLIAAKEKFRKEHPEHAGN